jgi:hypothetical protein
MLQKTHEEVVDESHKGCSQPTIPAKMKFKEKDYVDMQWALWFFLVWRSVQCSGSKAI